MVGRINCLYMKVRVSFCCPKEVPVSVLSTFSFVCTFFVMFFMWGVKLMCVSYVMPSIVGVLLRGRRWLKSVMCGWRLDSRLSGVRSVVDDFSADAVIRLFVSHCSRSVMYCCNCCVAVI